MQPGQKIPWCPRVTIRPICTRTTTWPNKYIVNAEGSRSRSAEPFQMVQCIPSLLQNGPGEFHRMVLDGYSVSVRWAVLTLHCSLPTRTMRGVTETKARRNSLDFLSSNDSTTGCDAPAKSLGPTC